MFVMLFVSNTITDISYDLIMYNCINKFKK